MDNVFKAPDLVRPLGWFGWTGFSVLLFIVMIGAVGAGIYAAARLGVSKRWWAGGTCSAIVAAAVEFRLFRALAPDQNATVGWLTAACVLVPLALALALNVIQDGTQWPAVASTTVLAVAAVAVAYALDRINERMAVAPLAWGVVILGAAGAVIWAYSESRR